MYFKAAVVLSLAVSALALPTTGAPVQKRGVLKAQSYAQFQVSDGVAGKALEEVQANFPIDENDLANVDAADLKIIEAARETAEGAEVDAGGFNEAIAAAAKGSAEADALEVGKIKNKVLKLKLETLALQIQGAQGEDTADKLAEEQTKLDKNVQLDQKAAGETSQSVDFEG